MKAFRFQLQAVLTLRGRAEQAAQQRCAQVYAAVERAAVRLRFADSAIAASDEMRRTQLVAGARAHRVEQLRSHSVLLQERRTRLALELAEAQQQAEEAGRLLTVATQRREALDRLRSRQRRVHDYQAGRAEQKLLDELSGRGPTLVDAWRETPLNL